MIKKVCIILCAVFVVQWVHADFDVFKELDLLPFKPVPEASVLEEGFVAFASKSYFPLLEIMLDSVHYFSTRPVIVYGINDDIPYDTDKYPRLIKRRIDMDPEKIKRPWIFYQKPNIILKCGIRYGIYIEADDILNYGVDNLFAIARKVDRFPICPVHQHDPCDQKEVMDALGVTEKSMPYVHGHVLFSYKCLPFISEWYQACQDYGHLATNADESVLNVMLWKYKSTFYTSVFDPYSKEALEAYLEGSPAPKSYSVRHKVKYYMFHGSKNRYEARSIFNTLVAYANEHNLPVAGRTANIQ